MTQRRPPTSIASPEKYGDLAKRLMRLLGKGCLAAFCIYTVEAGEIYTWVNQAGMTIFSDQPPASEAARISILSLPSATGGDPERKPDGYFSVINQAQRMEAARREREAALLEERRLYAEILRAKNEARRAAAAQYKQQDDDQRYGGYIYRYPYYPYRPGMGPPLWPPQPSQPIARPPSYGRYHR